MKISVMMLARFSIMCSSLVFMLILGVVVVVWVVGVSKVSMVVDMFSVVCVCVWWG